MNHFILLVICLLSVEIFIRSDFYNLISSTIELSKKSIFIILNKNISDHWKEIVIPKYSLKMMKLSLQMLLAFLFIIFILLFSDKFLSDFLSFALSLNGIIESSLFAFTYAYFRKQILR